METKRKAKITFKSRVILFIIITCFFSTSSAKMATALNGADIALYNDSVAPPGESGTWQDGITAIKNMLTWLDLTYEEIDYDDLSFSTQDFSSLYKVLIFPGGYAHWYNYWISKSGKERIRNFVNSGGGYFGICAGAFFAADRVVWEGVMYDDNWMENEYGELTGYDLNLFPGTGTGPINEIADWDTEGYNITTFNFENDNTVLSGYKPIPYSEDILYYGGPYFSIDQGAEVEVLATYEYNGEPAIVAFQYGLGKVVLSAPHPEIEEDSDRDGVTIDREDEMDDNGSDWKLALHIFNWLMNVESTITHALTPPSNTTISRGSLLGPFYASATNNTSSTYSFYVYPNIVTPDGDWILMFTNLVTLAAGGTSYANNGNDVYMWVPPFAPTGTHYHCVNVYDTSYNLIDQDCFSFEVIAGSSFIQCFRNFQRLRRLMKTPGAHVVETDDWKIIIVPKKRWSNPIGAGLIELGFRKKLRRN
jgi:glutamine amidotransferase-like uncharacterized protein